jgi:hypothetical protein
MRSTPLAVTIVVALAASAAAQPHVGGGAWLHYELQELHAIEDDAGAASAGIHDLVLAGVRLHGFVGRRFAYHAGIDFAAGSTIGRGGFAYDVALFPFGVAVRLGRTGVMALGAGIGASGAVGTLDDAVTMPLELTAEIGGGRVRFLLRGRASYVAGADARRDGAPTLTAFDEVEGTFGIRIGHSYEEWGFPSGNGYFVGASYRELMGTRFAGLVIGYSIDGGTARHDRLIDR